MILTVAPEDYEFVPVWRLDKEKFLKVSSILPKDTKKELGEFLKRNVDLFPWKLEDILGINLDIITYELNVEHMKKLV